MKLGKLSILSGAVLLLVGCGLVDPKVVVYDTNPTATVPQGEDVGLQAFTSSIGTAAQSCATGSCHGAQPIAGSTLGSDAAKNRNALLKFIKNNSEGGGCDAAALFGKITGSHGGGNQGNAMPQASIEQWLAAETQCQG